MSRRYAMARDRRDFLRATAAGIVGVGASMTLGRAVAQTAPPEGVPKEPLKIGVMAAQSGVMAVPGVAALTATKIWVEQVNKAGGILGRTIELKIEEETGAKETVERFKKLTLQEKVDVVVGLMSTGNGQAVGQEAEALKQLWLSWDATTQKGVVEGQPVANYSFRSVDNELEAIAGAILTAKLFPDVKRVTGINNDYSYGRDCWEAYCRVLKMYRPGVVFEEPIFTKLGETEFSAAIDALAAKKPDLIMSSFWSGDTTIFLKQAAAKRLFERTKGCFTTGGGVHDTLKKEFTPEGLILGYNSYYFLWTDNWPMSNEFVKTYYERTKTYPVYECDHAWFVLQAYKAAVEKCYALLKKWPTKEQIIEALRGIQVPSLSGYRGYRKDNKQECCFFMGVTTHKNPYDFVTIDPVHIFPSASIQKPEGYTFDQWLQEWEKKVKEVAKS
jgi:branched-chain amino acid transport system substrate-binding protein